MYSQEIQKLIQEDQLKLKACKSKEDLNKLWKGRKIIVKDGSAWENEVCDFVEMVGEGKRENWKMKLKTSFGTFLDLNANQVIVTVQQITTTQKEASVIKNDFIAKGFKAQ